MTPEKYTPPEKDTLEDPAIKQIRRSIHHIENRLEHMLEKLETCLEALNHKEENGLGENDLYANEDDEW